MKNLYLVLFLLIGTTSMVIAQTVWDGLPVTFTKDPGADWTLEVNQDRITDSVWITRAATMGIFNIAVEDNYTNDFSPAGTEWGFGATDRLDTIEFSDWKTAIDQNPPSMLNREMVVHLQEEDIYIDIMFTDWSIGGGSGGGFSYVRSSDPLSTDNPEIKAQYTVSPNPASDILNISIPTFKSDYSIIDVTGQKVKQGTVKDDGIIEVSELKAGTYFILFSEGYSLRFLKIK